MTNEERYKNIPETLLPKIAAYAKITAKQARGVCQRHNVPTDTADALIADVEDLLHGHYYPMHATLTQMRLLCKNVSRKSWDKTDNAALGLITMYYRDIIATLEGVSINFPSVTAFLNLWAVSLREAVRRAVTEDGKPIDGVAINEEEYDNELLDEQAQRLYYTYCVQIIGERTDATEEELRAIDSIVEYDDRRKERCISMALDMRQQRRRIEETEKKQRQQQPLMQIYTNINALTANMELADKDEDIFKPLRIIIEENKRRAQELLQNPYTKDEDKRQAAALITSTTAMYQVLDGLQLIASKEIPCSANTKYVNYKMTAYRFTQICTGQDSPNSRQVLAIMNAAEMLRHYNTQAVEKGYRYYKGKKISRDIWTQFQPIVLELTAEIINQIIPTAKAVEIEISIHKIIVDGRSGNRIYYKDENGKALPYYIAPQNKILLPEAAFTAFRTDEEKRFRATILNVVGYEEDGLRKGRITEMNLLKKVFDYDARQKLLDDAAKEAATLAAKYPEDEALRAAAETAREAAKRQISAHISRDVLKLSEMFTKAQDVGLISNTQPYIRREAKKKTGSLNKYGENWVYEWTIREETPKNLKEKNTKA